VEENHLDEEDNDIKNDDLGNTAGSLKLYKTHLSLSGEFFANYDEEIEIDVQNSRSPPIPAMSSVQKDMQDAEEYISELRKRHEQMNNEPEGAQWPLLFMIPVLVSFFLVVTLST
jgi:hypothetical protein